MSSFAIYRLPNTQTPRLIRQSQGEPLVFHSLIQLGTQQGFVIAPFRVSQETPIVLIQGEDTPWDGTTHVLHHSSPSARHPRKSEAPSPSVNPDYAIDFANFHAQLLDDTFQKIVLSRMVEEERPAHFNPFQLFCDACQRYPRLFVCLVSTPQTGTWLTATPEVLLENVFTHPGTPSHLWHTMALAGTMPAPPESPFLPDSPLLDTWSAKNIQEQRCVATYVMECLQHFSNDITETGPVTIQAAQVLHLRSDFTFTLPLNSTQSAAIGSVSSSADDANCLGHLLDALHPTPAVCGLPKQQTFQFINRYESHDRRYYSGFMGPLNAHAATHLFVSLRSMEILPQTFRLYAGGGLLKESQLQQEWDETQAKMLTMRSLVHSSSESTDSCSPHF